MSSSRRCPSNNKSNVFLNNPSFCSPFTCLLFFYIPQLTLPKPDKNVEFFFFSFFVRMKSIKTAQWPNVPWRLCFRFHIAVFHARPLCSRLSFFPSLSLFNNADALDQLQASEEGAMLGHLCMSVSACAGIHEHVCGSWRR